VSNLYRGQRQGSFENGFPMNQIRGYKTDGIFQTTQEVDEYKDKINDAGYVNQKAPGDIRFVDINGAPKADSGLLQDPNPDGTINAYDQTYLGKSLPGYYYGITLGADYKNWDIVLGFRGTGDVQSTFSRGINTLTAGSNYDAGYRNRWTPNNPTNKIPRAMQGDPSGNNRGTLDRYVFNAGFLRFQNFQIGYNFNGDLISRVGLSNLRCYISGTNLFVISPYPDLDPENVTTPTVFSFGVNVSF